MKNRTSGSSALVKKWGGNSALFILHNSSFIIPLLLLAACFLVYLPVLRGGFIWDDDILVWQNPLLHSVGGLAATWRGEYSPDYFPLTSTLFWLEYHVWGAWAPGYHCVNVLLHAVAAILLWRLLLRLRIPWAWLAALLFAVHPVAVGTVAWIAEGKNTLCMVLALAAALLFPAHLKEPRARFSYAASLLCFLLALLAKTAVVTLPVALLLFPWWRTGTVNRRDLIRTAPFFLLSLVFGLVTIRFQAQRAIVGAAIPLGGFTDRLGASAKALAWYFFHILAPVRLDILPPALGFGPSFWLQAAAMAGALALACRFRASWPGRGFLFGFALFALILLPILGVAKMYFFVFAPVADHLAYFAIPILAAMLAGAAGHIAREHARLRVPLGISVGVLAAAFAAGSYLHSAAYRDRASLWSCAVRQNPASFETQMGYALVLLDEGRVGEAIQHGQTAVRKNPSFLKAHLNLGLMEDRAGQFDQSIAEYQEAARLAPSEPDPPLALGHVLIEAGDYSGAIANLAAGLRLNPADAGGHNNLALALEKSGRIDEAIAEYRQGADLKPDFPPYRRNLAALLFQAGRLPEAAREFVLLVRMEPGNADNHNDLGAALRLLGRLDEARAQFREALRLNPAHSLARENLDALSKGDMQ